MNFGGIEPAYEAFEKARFVVIPVPYDLTTTYQGGARKGPASILEASANMELYDEELRTEPYKSGIHTLPALEPVAAGPEGMLERVEEAVSGVIEARKIPVVLGGEHSITLGAVRAAKKNYRNLSVLHFDAHADLRDSYQGTPYSHACVARRMSELCPIVQLGIRSMSVEEADIPRKAGIVQIPPSEIRKGAQKVANALRKLSRDVYITFDLDALDPSIMPATGTPEPGGMLWHEAISILRDVCAKKNIVGFDVVELAPIPGLVAPDFLAARLAYRMMGYTANKPLSKERRR